MPTQYDASAPKICLVDHDKDVLVQHNHWTGMNYLNWQQEHGRDRTRQEIDHQITAVSGCLTFFKVYAAEAGVDIKLKAAASAAVAEDEARLKELKRHRPSGCSIS